MLLTNAIALAFASLYEISKHKKNIQNFSSNTSEIDLSWLQHIVLAMLILVGGIALFNLIFYQSPLNLFMNLFTYTIVLFTAYHALRQKEIIPIEKTELRAMLSMDTSESAEDSQNKKLLSDEKLQELKLIIQDLIDRDEIYLDNDLNLGKMARLLNVSTHQLSYVINKGFKQNFNSLINNARIEKAKKLLAENKANKYSIVGIAYESGFNSKTSFYNTFKKFTGHSPSEFINPGSD